ncbi:MAG: carboxypeptidase-like regulatory domain-containing protein, partial [Methanoregula sp.]|nr:carboxypeptidase-like regulatory domain-containing protein [Methanoregula sp.]
GTTMNPVSRRDEILLLKLDAKGTEQWIRTVGTDDDESAQSIASARDGGYVIAGTACHRGRNGDCAIHVIRIDAAGTALWDRLYGGTGRTSATGVLASPEGGYTLAGYSDSPERGALGRDVHILHIDETGSEQWNSTFGTPLFEIVTGAIMTNEGSLVLTGYATDPVETPRRSLFITSLGRAGRDMPPELLHSATLPRKDTGLEVSIRDEKSGAGIAGAEVYFDGKLAGRTSQNEGKYLIANPGTGSHSVRIVKPGYRETTIMTNSKTGPGLIVKLQPSAIQRISGDASPETALDIVFVPSGTSYDCSLQKKIIADQYRENPEIFVNDTMRLSELRLYQLGSYSSVPAKIADGYQQRMNLYYYWDGERYADAFNGCAGTLPEGFWDEAPFADVAIILYPKYYGPNKGSPCEPIGCTNGVGPGTSTWFKAPANNGQVFLHEAGHAIFGLMDTYCGDTYYSENSPFPNVWQSENNCISDTVKKAGTEPGCRPIKGSAAGSGNACMKEYWKYDQEPDLMATTNPTARFGEISTQRIQYIFDTVGRRI